MSAQQNPTLSQVAEPNEPALPFEVLLRVSPAVSRAMKSLVPLPALTEFIHKIGFNCDHKNVIYVGDLKVQLLGEDHAREIEHCIGMLVNIEAERVAHMEFNSNVYATFYAPQRWSGYYVVHTHDRGAIARNRLHLLKVV